MTHVILQSVRLDASIASVTQGTPRVLYEPGVSQLHVALLTAEARWVPVRIHCLYHATDYEFT